MTHDSELCQLFWSKGCPGTLGNVICVYVSDMVVEMFLEEIFESVVQLCSPSNEDRDHPVYNALIRTEWWRRETLLSA